MSTEKAVTTSSLKRELKCGATNGLTVATLASRLDTTERTIRKLVDELIEEGIAVCAHPSTGYYIAATQEEAQATHDFLRSRGLHSLKKASLVMAAFAGGTLDDDRDEPIPDY